VQRALEAVVDVMRVPASGDPSLAVLPDALQVTREPLNGSANPSARVIVAWAP